MSKLIVDTAQIGTTKTNTIAPQAGTDHITRTGYRPGQIIEVLSGDCDGQTISVLSGDYTLTDVTAAQSSTASYAIIQGSSISYVPPTGTNRVLYKFFYHFDVTSNSGISHHKFQIDGNDVYKTADNIASNYASTNWNHACFPVEIVCTIKCNASATDVNKAEFTSWTSPKTLRCAFRGYSTSYTSALHWNNWWDGTGSSSYPDYAIMKPHLTIMAIA